MGLSFAFHKIIRFHLKENPLFILQEKKSIMKIPTKMPPYSGIKQRNSKNEFII